MNFHVYITNLNVLFNTAGLSDAADPSWSTIAPVTISKDTSAILQLLCTHDPVYAKLHSLPCIIIKVQFVTITMATAYCRLKFRCSNCFLPRFGNYTMWLFGINTKKEILSSIYPRDQMPSPLARSVNFLNWWSNWEIYNR